MKKNKLFLLTFSFILTFLFFTASILVYSAKKEYSLQISNQEGTNYIDNITIGVTSYNLKEYTEENEELDFLEESGKIKINENDLINIKVNDLNNIYIHFDKNDSDGKVQITYKSKKLILDLKKENNDYFSISTSQADVLKKNIKKLDKNIYFYIIASILVFFALYFMLNNMQLILKNCKDNKKIKIIDIIILFLEYFAINLLCMIPILELFGSIYSVFILLQMIAIIYYFKDIIKKKLEFAFPFLAIIVLINIAIILPPFHVPDEFAHYLKAYSLFHKEDIVLSDGGAKIRLSENVDDSIYKYMFAIHSYDYKTSFKEYYIDANKNINDSKTKQYSFLNTYGINSFAYIPSGLVIYFSVLMGWPFILTTILGRIVNALLFIIFGTIVLNLMPKYKKLMFLILLFPITIQQTAAINQDSLTLSFGFLLTAFLFSKILDEKTKVERKDIILIILLSLCLGLCKPGYFPICLLTFLIPKTKFKNKKQELFVKFLPLIICCAASLNKYIDAGEISSKDIDGIITLSYIIKHPFTMIKLILNTFYLRGTNDILNFQLNMFGWSTVYYHDLPATIIYFFYTMLVFFDNNEKQLKTIERISYLIIGVMIFCIVYASALLSFRTTPIGGNMISGLQSRYFIPSLIFIYIGLSNNLLKINAKNPNLIIVVIVLLTFLMTFYTILEGFYL